MGDTESVLDTDEGRQAAELLGLTDQLAGKKAKAAAPPPAPPSSPPAGPTAPPATPSEKPSYDLDSFRKTLGQLSEEDRDKLLADETVQPFIQRKAQSLKDQELHNQRQRIAAEEREKVRAEAERQEFEKWFGTASDQDVGRFYRQNARLQGEHGRTIANWWTEQSQSLKDTVAELKGKSMEEWAALFQQYPNSFGEAIGAMIDEVANQRNEKRKAEMEKDIAKLVKAQAEVMFKERWAKSTGELPDLASSPPPGDDKDFLDQYAEGKTADHARAKRLLAALR